jgi:type II secretory pathway component HofQ
VTLKLNDVPWDQAFDLLARVNGLRWKRQGNVMAVGFAEELAR